MYTPVVRASWAPIWVNGTEAERFALWQQAVGQIPPPDLSRNFAVQWGKHNERFVLDWHEYITGIALVERQRQIMLSDWLGCTLDSFCPELNAVFEVKVVNPDSRPAELVTRYAPQVLVQMRCRGAGRGFLLVQQGNSPPQDFEVLIDDAYANRVIVLLEQFRDCIESRTPPGPPPPPPVPPERWRTVDLAAETLPNWGRPMQVSLDQWADTRGVAKLHDEAKASVKELLPDDVGKVIHGGIVVKRNRNNAISIKTEHAT